MNIVQNDPDGTPDGALLALSDERDAYIARIGQAYRQGWHAGYRDGYAAGRADEATERDRAWNAIARRAHADGQAYAELERIRWTVRGQRRIREAFSRPHPDDYPGRDGGTSGY